MILDSNVFCTLPEETGIGAQTLTIFDESSLYYDFASKGTRCLHAIQDATAETLTKVAANSVLCRMLTRGSPEATKFSAAQPKTNLPGFGAREG